MREWTLDQAANAVLKAQGLIERFATPQEALRSTVAMQSQYFTSPRLALAARSRLPSTDFEAKFCVRGWNLRSTIHTFLREDHGLLVHTVCAFYRKYFVGHNVHYNKSGLSLDQIEDRILKALESGPKGRKELHGLVSELQDYLHTGWGQDVKGLSFLGKVNHVGGNEPRFALIDPPGGGATFTDLARRYLAGYGPATMRDFAYWAGIYVPPAREGWSGIQKEVEEVAINGIGKGYFVLTGTPDPPKANTKLRLLPKFDAVVLGHRDKSRFLRTHSEAVLRPAGQIEAVIMRGPVVVGTWRSNAKGEITLFPFDPLTAKEHVAAEREAARLGMRIGEVVRPR